MSKRSMNLDILKIIAMFFVVVLHVLGYSNMTTGAAYSRGVDMCYHFLDALSYPAIHIFALCGFSLMSRKMIATNQGQLLPCLKVWVPTWIICIIGLIIAIPLGIPFDMTDLIKTVFPFLGQGYWFVSAYISMILLTPFLNLLIQRLDKKGLLRLVLILFVLVSVLPTLPGRFNWNSNYSSLTLFVLLYFMAALLNTLDLKRYRFIGLVLFVGCAVANFLLWFGLKYILSVETAASNEYFYTYYNPLVILQGMGLYIFVNGLDGVSYRDNWVSKIVRKAADATLVTYLIHMYPIIKNSYVPAGLLTFMNSHNGLIYALQALTLCVLVCVVGTLAAIPVNKMTKYLLCGIQNRNKMVEGK